MTQSTMRERASALWVGIWNLAGEQWPPNGIPAAWRVYEHPEQALAGMGISHKIPPAFADDLFHRQDDWGDLERVSNHQHRVEALVAVLLDSESAGWAANESPWPGGAGAG